ncbi:MAG: hypothetical protein H0W06_09705 [Chloroflexia bacterium]|nr:hypothetical protein [Chloroflexia bacterium]
MSIQTEIDAEQQARISAHMALYRRFMQMVFADPAIADEIPGGAFLYLLPEDDPELAAVEQAAADKAARAGKLVYVRSLPPA